MAAETWSAVLDELRQRIPANAVALWIEPARPLGIEDGRLVLSAPDPYFAWIARRYASLLGELVRQVSSLDGIILRLCLDEPATGELAA